MGHDGQESLARGPRPRGKPNPLPVRSPPAQTEPAHRRLVLHEAKLELDYPVR